MKFLKTKIDGLMIIELESRLDDRGSLTRFFCQKELAENGIQFTLAQAYQSESILKNTLRGLHYQQAPMAEDKIIQCLRGAIFDVAVDLRSGSPTFGQWVSQELNEDNQKLFVVPKGFAHGYQTLTDNSLVQCLASEVYSPQHEAGLRYDDPMLGIQWPQSGSVVSEKDQNWPLTKS